LHRIKLSYLQTAEEDSNALKYTSYYKMFYLSRNISTNRLCTDTHNCKSHIELYACTEES